MAPRTAPGPIPGSTVTRYPSVLQDGEVFYSSPDGMGMGAQGRSYFQGAIPSMRSDVSSLTMATDRRIVIIGSDMNVRLAIPWSDVEAYWRGQIPFPSVPPETDEGIVVFIGASFPYLPFPGADLVIDPRGDADAWEAALQDQGKPRRG